MSMENNYNDEDQQYDVTKYCKTCGCPLVSDSQFDECDDCRRKKAEKTAKAGVAALGIIGIIVWIAKLFGGSSKDNY